jgi:pyruvate/2-oxoglutarate/acetoin dehydrogenase E1 component
VLVLEPDSATDPDPVDGPVGDPAAELLGTARRRLAGDDVTVVALGRLVGPALAAAERLAGRGVRVEVVDVRTLAPLDLATLTASVAHTGRLVVAADTLATGAVVTARLVEAAFYDLDAAAVQVTPPSGGTGVGAVAAVVAAVERARR